MREVRVSDCAITVPKGSAFALESPPNLPKLCQLFLGTARRGSGKSIAISNLVRMYGFDRVFLISPTADSNRAIWAGIPIDPEDIFVDPDAAGVADEILQRVQAEADDLVRYREELKAYNKLQKGLRGQGNLADEIVAMFFSEATGDFERPDHRWNGRKARLALICDDCQSTRLFRDKRFLNMVTRHRHLGQLPEGGALGLSMFVAAQNLKSVSGGVPRTLRNNATSMGIWAMKDTKELLEAAEEVGGEVDRETFMRLHAEATKDPYGFLLIDFHPRPNHPSMFRRNFDTFLCP